MNLTAEIKKKIKHDRTEMLVESDMVTRISNSSLDEHEKQNFLHLLAYFTPAELEELKELLS